MIKWSSLAFLMKRLFVRGISGDQSGLKRLVEAVSGRERVVKAMTSMPFGPLRGDRLTEVHMPDWDFEHVKIPKDSIKRTRYRTRVPSEGRRAAIFDSGDDRSHPNCKRDEELAQLLAFWR